MRFRFFHELDGAKEELSRMFGIDIGVDLGTANVLVHVKGKGIVLVSSQLDELISTCDRIAVLRRGELDAPRAALEWTEEKLLLEVSS